MTTVNLVAYCGSAPLTNVWVYLKEGDAFTRLRADGDGLLLKTISTDDDPEIASFVEPLVADAPSTIFLGWSRNGLPLPSAMLELVATAFTEVELDLKPENLAPLPDAPIASHEINTVQATPLLKAVLPPPPVTFKEPTSLDLWPMFAEPFTDEYLTDGLAQGASLWPDDHLALKDGQAATPASATLRPKDLGVGVQGTVANGGTQVSLYLLDAKGAQLKFRLTPATNAPAVEVTTIDVQIADGKSTFATRLFVDDPKRFFGLVQLAAVTKQGQPEGWGTVTAMLLGVQLGLCDDHPQSHKGDMPGPPAGPAHEKNVIDFTTTAVAGPLPATKLDTKSKDPKIVELVKAARRAALAALSEFGRARRMVCFPIRADRERPNARTASGPAELRPEMPLWMAELQLLGFKPDEGQTFLQARQSELGIDNRAVAIAADFALTLSWRGPDNDLPGPARKDGSPRNPYSSVSMSFKGTFRGDGSEKQGSTAATAGAAPAKVEYDSGATVTGTIDIDDDGNLRVSKDGVSTAEVNPPYAAAPYPAPGRRIPGLLLDQRMRSWGWTADGPVVPTLVLEWQPPIVTTGGNGFNEIMLGGDGRLDVANLMFAGKAVARPDVDTTTPSTTSLLALPTFRVRGDNPADASALEKLVDAAVDDVISAHPNDGPVQILSAAVWKRLARTLMFHESGGQHFSSGVNRATFLERTPFQCHGIQPGMPKFGAPAGYGLGQHDPPRSLQDMWNFYEHVRLGIEMLITKEFGKKAYEYLTGLHALVSTDRLDKAIFLRETVRGYNGGREFVYDNDHWKLKPWVGKNAAMPAARLPYVNTVLGTPRLTYPHVIAADESVGTLAGTMESLL